MNSIFTNLFLLLNTEAADINQYIWDSYQGRVEFSNVEILEDDNRILFDVQIALNEGWKGYYPNEQNGGNELKLDLIEQNDEIVLLDFPDPEILYFYEESFIGYKKDYTVSGIIENVDFQNKSQTLKVNISFCNNLCVPEEFEIYIK